MPRYLIGIDLGTTNSALAYIDLPRKARDGRPEVQTFHVPQLVNPSDVKARELLPSFLYLPGAHDLPAVAGGLAGDKGGTHRVGGFRRDRGGKSSGRVGTPAE